MAFSGVKVHDFSSLDFLVLSVFGRVKDRDHGSGCLILLR